MNSLLIQDSGEFRSVWTRFKSTFDLERRLPEQVLRRRPGEVAFFEFEEVFSENFWSALQQLGEHWDEGVVAWSSIEPDPDQHFRRELGFYGAALLPLELGPAAYVELLTAEPAGHPADSFVTRCDVLAYASCEGGFAIWADRALDLGLLATFDTGRGLPPRMPKQIDWFDPERACTMITPVFGGRPAPTAVRRAMVENYGADGV